MKKEKTYEIGQSYIKFDFKANKDFKAVFEKYLLYKGKVYAKEFYHKEFLSDVLYFAVELEDGSLKSRLRIFGTISTRALIAFAGISAGIDYIIRDSQMVTEHIVQDIVNEQSIDPNLIVRVERRLGIPGKIKRLYNNIERIKINRQNLTENQQQNIINRISKQYKELVYELGQSEAELIGREIRENNIPLQPANEDEDIYYPEVNAIREERIKLISENKIAKTRQALPSPR